MNVYVICVMSYMWMRVGIGVSYIQEVTLWYLYRYVSLCVRIYVSLGPFWSIFKLTIRFT